MTPLLLFAMVAGFGCRPVDGDRILGRDLAAASPAFRSLPAEEFVSYAPPLGGRKTLSADDLLRVAKEHQIAVERPAPVCFETPTGPLDPADVRAAMRRALGLTDAAVDIVEISPQPVPHGELVFSRSALSSAGSGRAVLWRGFVRYGGDRRFDVWARVALGPPEVAKGASVRVEVRSGAAKLVLDGLAESAGRRGDHIVVKNPSSGKYFSATVAGPGTAVIWIAGGER